MKIGDFNYNFNSFMYDLIIYTYLSTNSISVYTKYMWIKRDEIMDKFSKKCFPY